MSSKSTKKSTGLNDPDDCLDDDRGRQRAIVGSNGDDTLTGTAGAYTIIGRNGNDSIEGGAGNDNIDGGKGNDAIFGDEGNDRLNGGQGDDTLTGGAGNDYIDGGPHGYDTARYLGKHTDYDITFSAGPLDSEGYKITVVGKGDWSSDGTDTLRRVDVLEFSDGEIRDGQFFSNNTPATIGDPPAASVTEDTDVTDGNLVVSDTISISDPESGEASFRAINERQGNLGALNLASDGWYSYTVANDAVQYLGATDTKVERFTITSVDGTTKVVSFTIHGTNDAPMATDVTVVTGENTTLTTTVPLVASDVDGTIDATGYVLETGLGTGNGTLEFGSDGTYSFDPGTDFDALAPNSFRDVSFTYTAKDNLGLVSAPKTVTIHVTGANEAPMATDVTVVTGENTTLTTTVPLVASDVDGTIDATGYVLETGLGTGNGTLEFDSDGTYSFDPGTDFDALAPNSFRDVSFTYTAKDNLGLVSAPKTVTIHVTGTNDAPVLSDTTIWPAVIEVAGDSSAQDLAAITGSFELSDQDIGDTLRASVVDSPTVLLNGNTFALPAGATALTADAFGISPPTQTSNGGTAEAIGYTYDPAAVDLDFLREGQNLTITYQVKVYDGTEDSTTQDVTFTITGTNDAPTLVLKAPVINDADTWRPDVARGVSGQLSTSDLDAGDSHTYGVLGPTSPLPSGGSYDLASDGTYGTLYLNSASGKYRFIYNAEFDKLATTDIGKHDDFTFTVDDENATDSKTLTINLKGTNDATVIRGVEPFDYTINTDGAKVVAPKLMLEDADSLYVTSAKVWVSNGFTAGDTLNFELNTLLGGRTYTYDEDHGVLTIEGNGTLEEYKEILNSVTFYGTEGADGRTIAFQVFDGSLKSAPAYTDNLSLLDLSTAVLRLPGVALDDISGFSVSAAGDVNHDGYGDLIIGAPFADIGGDLSGSSYVVYGKDSDFGDELPLVTLNGSNGFTISGTNELDRTGFSVRGAGDVNGDGFSDVIIGAPYSNAQGQTGGLSQFGGSYVVFGHLADTVAAMDLSTLDGTNGFGVIGAGAANWAGYSAGGAGDVNGDGFDDVIIGAPTATTINGNASGAAYVLFGGDGVFGTVDPETQLSDGTLDLANLTSDQGFMMIGAREDDWTGASVSAAGDINGDGIGDLIIGTATATPEGSPASATGYVVFGNAVGFGESVDLSKLNGTDGFSFHGAGGGIGGRPAWAHYAVRTAGDVNGDGFDDVIIGAPYANTSHPAAVTATGVGASVTVDALGTASHLDTNSLLTVAVPVVLPDGVSYNEATHEFTLDPAGTPGEHKQVAVNYVVTNITDPDAPRSTPITLTFDITDIDGNPMVTAELSYATGAAYVVFGHDDQTTPFTANLDLQTLNGAAGFKLIGVADGDRAGYSVSGAGDVNGDGYDDLIIGAPSAQQDGNPAGTSYLIFGKDLGFGTVDLFNLGGEGFRITAAAPNNDSGYAVSAAGDLNGDGFADLLVASSSASPHTGEYAGESYVIFGSKFIVAEHTQVGAPVPVGISISLEGTSESDVLISGQGDAEMFGNGGVDSFSGGVGNDTIYLGVSLGVSGSDDSRFLKIDGGGNHDGGFDTLVFKGSGMELNLTTPGVAGKIHNIERIDLTGSGDNTLVLDVLAVLNMDDNSNTLFIDGDAGDIIDIGLGWAQPPVGDETGVTYVTYDSDDHVVARLFIDPDLTITPAI